MPGFNPMSMMQMFMGGGKGVDPMSLMTQQFQGNPMFQQAQKMAQGKSPQEIEQIARNICKQKGIDLDQAMAQFKQMASNFK